MSRIIGTVSRGLRAPIVRKGDDLAKIVVDSIMQAVENGDFEVRDRDVIAVTESIVARVQGNIVSIDDIAADVKAKFGGETVGVIHPIFSRNRFSICLRGIAKGCKKVVLMLSYPSDEVGNHLFDLSLLNGKDINPYKELIEECGAEAEIIFANDPCAILNYTKKVLHCDIHTRFATREKLKAAGAEIVYGMDQIMNAPIGESGWNEKYGLLGSNKTTEEKVKLFPRDCQGLVEEIQKRIFDLTGKHIEAMVYGDGAFKDPVGKIWELADPVVSPAYTAGLEGTPNELKLKYLADNDFASLSGEALRDAIKNEIAHKDAVSAGPGDSMAAQGTTPRRLTDLIGSLCDLTSGSGDKGTPFVYIQGYFDNYTAE